MIYYSPAPGVWLVDLRKSCHVPSRSAPAPARPVREGSGERRFEGGADCVYQQWDGGPRRGVPGVPDLTFFGGSTGYAVRTAPGLVSWRREE